MKKFLALMALLLCFTVLFVACNNNDEPQSSEKPTDPIVVPAGCEHAYDNACDADCNLCGEKRAPAAHVEETIAAVAPTCTKAGLTEGKICTVCGVITVEQQVDPAKGHTGVAVAGVAATCTTSGLTDGEVCSVCDAVVVAQEVIFATGHDVVVVEGKAATCAETGLTSGKKCSVCDVWVQEQSVIPMTEHVKTTVPSIAPTCTEDGYKGATVCTVCEEVFSAEAVIPALGHKSVAMEDVESTCTKAGYEGGMHCSVCGVVTVEPTPTKLAKHTPKRVSGYDPTCTTSGLSDGSVCKDCGEVIKAQTIIPAAHGELVVLPALDPTCYTVGYTEGAMCSVCNGTVVAQTVIPNQHTYTYACDTNCGICGFQRWNMPEHVHGITPKGAYGCIYECGEATYGILATPDSYTAGELLDTMKNQAVFPNVGVYDAENGYVTISGASTAADAGTDKVYSVANGASGRYVVLRYRTTDPTVTFRFVTYSTPAEVLPWPVLGTAGEWQIAVVDGGANYQGWMEFRCNIGASENGETNISHIATFADVAEAYVYASQLGRYVDNQCPHYEYEIGWGGSVICKYCYEEAVPTTSHVGAQIYNAIDATSPDFDLITDNGSQGVTVTGTKIYNYGGDYSAIPAAELILNSDVDFGKYMVVVYKMDAAEAFLGVSANGGIASYAPVAQAANKWAVCGYGATNVEPGTTLAMICNFAGMSNSVSIQAIYTFDSQAAAAKYAEMLSAKCFHDETAVNELGQTVCTACGTIRGATAEWPLDLESGFVTTPEFVAGTSMMDPGVQEFHYSYYAEYDHKLVLDYYGDNISIIVNGFYAPALSADVKAGDTVEVVVYATWSEDPWGLITDGVFFIVDKAIPGTANNPLEVVLGENTTPKFVPSASMMDPGIQEYHYSWVSIDDGKVIISEMANIAWTVNGMFVEGYVADVKKGDVVEITVYAPMDDETWMIVTDPITFSVEFDVVHRFAVNEDGSITCNKDCHEPMVPTTYTNAAALNSKINNLGPNLSTALTNNAFSYNEAEGYISITGMDANGDPGMDHVIAVHVGPSFGGEQNVIQQYLVIRYRTDTPEAGLRFVVWGNEGTLNTIPTVMTVRNDMGTNGAWKTAVIDLTHEASIGERIDIRCNIGANQTDFSHIVSFTSLEEANSYANNLGLIVDGGCSHNGYKTEVLVPSSCTAPGLNRLSCADCGLVLEVPTEGGAHKFVADDNIVSCVSCGHVATASAHGAGDLLANATVDSGEIRDNGANGITVAGTPDVGACNILTLTNPNGGNFGQFVMVFYSMNTTTGFIGTSGQEGFYMQCPEMEAGAIRLDCIMNANVGPTLNILCNFNGGQNTTETNIIGVFSFDSFEAAAKWAEGLSYNATTSHVGANLIASVDSAEQGDANLMTKDAYSVTVKGVGTGMLGTTKIRLKNETGANFGQHVVILYKTNATYAGGPGFLGVTNTDPTVGIVYSDGMAPSTEKVAVYQLAVPTGGTMGAELELLLNFGGNAETWTTIYGVYTFETPEAAAAFAALNG